MKRLHLFLVIFLALAFAAPARAACTVTPSAAFPAGALALSASVGTGVTQVQYFIDGTVVSTNVNSPTYSVATTAPSVTPGQHTFFARATGSCGTGDSATVTVNQTNMAMCTGFNFSCAIASFGVECWGIGDSGQMGNGTATQTNTAPVPVNLGGANAASVACGAMHACALTTAGAVRCWGYNAYGQLGDGTTTNRTTSVAVSGLSSGVTQIGAGILSTCATLSTGAIKCWGDNENGQVGDGTTTTRTTPTASSITSGATMVAVSQSHACAVVSGGSAKCWGSNLYGGLGNGTTTDSLSPVQVSGLTSGVSWVTAGMLYSCGLQNGSAKCWGWNESGQLGNGTRNTIVSDIDQHDHDAHSPSQVSGLTSGVANIMAGEFTTCATTLGAAGKCWGLGSSGQAGDGIDYTTDSPHVVTTPASFGAHTTGTFSVTPAASVQDASCDVHSGAFYCVGGGDFGSLGDSSTAWSKTIVHVTGS